MSGSVSVAPAPLTAAEIVDVRRWCGYPPGSRTIGVDVVGQAIAPLTADEIAVLRATFLANLATLEAAVPAAGVNLDTAKAAVWERNANEVPDREKLFRDWRIKLCAFLGITSGPFLGLMIPGAFVV